VEVTAGVEARSSMLGKSCCGANENGLVLEGTGASDLLVTGDTAGGDCKTAGGDCKTVGGVVSGVLSGLRPFSSGGVDIA
jgi:hypothetical protein